MTRDRQSKSLKSREDTKICRFAAFAASLSAAAIVGYAVLKPAPVTVQAYHHTDENKIALSTMDKSSLNESKIELEDPAKEAKAPAKQEAALNPLQSNEDVLMETPAVQATTSQQALPAQILEQAEQTETAESTVPTVIETPATQSQAPGEEMIQAVEETESLFEEVAPASVSEPTPAPVQPTAAAQVDDGIWHVSYLPAWNAAAAPADGSIGIWADGWFIAHSHMPNGDKIASLPQYVEVDGQVYELRDTWISTDHVDTDTIARARANNGIVFQTCITDDTNRMVHYEPIQGPGYAYDFTSFPYTTTDAVLFGF